ncbi:type II toxin-antitoxin system CcdA family antitoxin [Sphingorhabdus sp.]|jgi:antitoxin CcdA|uniref:type II toxin-antitoxin system CcdA family antitoxin n=2 Tax=Sphingorhabdus sp. TaxID=1902408 RepID=UPI003BB06235|nr:type II toxin-antitoxin system CcdA family antitoxin [Sphingomonadales bacterium]MBK9433005.1 type II toxin-antitoxin system CcdA family antitoxin [Sphingomonadales bacterium]
MNRPSMFTGNRKATNISLAEDLVSEAKRLGINMSQICEKSLEQEVRKALGEEWKRENKAAIESWNKWVDQNGLPLAKYRQF